MLLQPIAANKPSNVKRAEKRVRARSILPVWEKWDVMTLLPTRLAVVLDSCASTRPAKLIPLVTTVLRSLNVWAEDLLSPAKTTHVFNSVFLVTNALRTAIATSLPVLVLIQFAQVWPPVPNVLLLVMVDYQCSLVVLDSTVSPTQRLSRALANPKFLLIKLAILQEMFVLMETFAAFPRKCVLFLSKEQLVPNALSTRSATQITFVLQTELVLHGATGAKPNVPTTRTAIRVKFASAIKLPVSNFAFPQPALNSPTAVKTNKALSNASRKITAATTTLLMPLALSLPTLVLLKTVNLLIKRLQAVVARHRKTFGDLVTTVNIVEASQFGRSSLLPSLVLS